MKMAKRTQSFLSVGVWFNSLEFQYHGELSVFLQRREQKTAAFFLPIFDWTRFTIDSSSKTKCVIQSKAACCPNRCGRIIHKECIKKQTFNLNLQVHFQHKTYTDVLWLHRIFRVNVAGSITFSTASLDSFTSLSHILSVNLLSPVKRMGYMLHTCQVWCSLANANRAAWYMAVWAVRLNWF